MTIMTHLKIIFIMTFFSGLLCWNLLNSSCKSISSSKVIPEYFLMTLGKFQFSENHLPRDDKLTLNQSLSGLFIGDEMLTLEAQRIRIY